MKRNREKGLKKESICALNANSKCKCINGEFNMVLRARQHSLMMMSSRITTTSAIIAFICGKTEKAKSHLLQIIISCQAIFQLLQEHSRKSLYAVTFAPEVLLHTVLEDSVSKINVM